MAPRKDEDLRVRVSDVLKHDLEVLAKERGEALSVIIREALNAYVARRPTQTVEEAPVGYLPSQSLVISTLDAERKLRANQRESRSSTKR